MQEKKRLKAIFCVKHYGNGAKMFNFSYRYLIGIMSRFLPMQHLCKNVQFFRRKNSVSLIFLCLKFVYLKNFDYLCARKGLRKIKTIDEIGIN